MMKDKIRKKLMEDEKLRTMMSEEVKSGRFERLMNLSKESYKQILNGVGGDTEMAKIIVDIVALRVRVAREIELSRERSHKKEDEDSPMKAKGTKNS